MTAATTLSPADTARALRHAEGQPALALSLADPESAERVAQVRAQITRTPEASVKFLKQVGILNRSGKLAKKFGG